MKTCNKFGAYEFDEGVGVAWLETDGEMTTHDSGPVLDLSTRRSSPVRIVGESCGRDIQWSE